MFAGLMIEANLPRGIGFQVAVTRARAWQILMTRGVERPQTGVAFPPVVFEFSVKVGGLVLGLVGPLAAHAQCQLGQCVGVFLYGDALSTVC